MPPVFDRKVRMRRISVFEIMFFYRENLHYFVYQSNGFISVWSWKILQSDLETYYTL